MVYMMHYSDNRVNRPSILPYKVKYGVVTLLMDIVRLRKERKNRTFQLESK